MFEAGTLSRRPLRILIVEDDPNLRAVYAEAMAMDGFDVLAVQDGLEAFEAFLLQGPFAALIVESDLPRLDGRQLLRQLRARGEHAPALLISGLAGVDDRERHALGVGPVLRKPFGLDRLSQVIRDLVQPRPAEA